MAFQRQKVFQMEVLGQGSDRAGEGATPLFVLEKNEFSKIDFQK